MFVFYEIYYWLVSFFLTGAEAVNWLITPISFGSLGSFTPLGIMTVSGFILIIPVAIWGWFKSIFL